MKKYQIAIYIRLSKEDDKYKEESNSITMQRILLQRFIAEHFQNDYDVIEFCDDGYTGTNFERPEMQRMLAMVKGLKIDCIIVKDFSRFARDYIELGAYLEQILPFMGVRFISVNDNYDSKDYKGSIADIDVNFKNLLYDLYSKDLSQKVRSSLAVRKEKGEYVSGNSPFGYSKDPEDRHGLVVAEDEAEVVKKIFSMALEGSTSVEIARLFNETDVKTPIQFKIEKGATRRKPKGDKFLWNSSSVCQILRNKIYIGNIVQRKTTKDHVGGKNHLNPREDWLVAYHHHEAIVDQNVFERIQEGRGGKRPPQHNQSHPLMGKVICGSCRRSLKYRRGLNPYFQCSQRYISGMEHCVEKVNAMYLEQYVLFMMQEKLQENGKLENTGLEEANIIEKEMGELKEKQKSLKVQMRKLNNQKFEAYQNYAVGQTDSFQSDNLMVESIQKELADVDKKIRELEAVCRNTEDKSDKLKNETQFAVLTKEMIERYIEQIIICDEQNIEICWKNDITHSIIYAN